jgi:hypothetical protein
MVEMVECLPSKLKALSSNPSTAKRKKKTWGYLVVLWSMSLLPLEGIQVVFIGSQEALSIGLLSKSKIGSSQVPGFLLTT